MIKRKGIILAGGNGSRLYPATSSVSKHILPIFDKPMIFYSLSTLMLANIKDILIISTSRDINLYKNLFGNGKELGLDINYAIQYEPKGIAEAFIIGKKFINNQPSALILGDNFFYGESFQKKILKVSKNINQSTIFSYRVADPQNYGVIQYKKNTKKLDSIVEKPKIPKNDEIVTGLYFYDKNVTKFVSKIKPSKRKELEITDINNIYLKKGLMCVERLGRGFTWFDTGTPENIFEASNFVSSIEKRQGLKIGCIEEISYLKKYINKKQLLKIIQKYTNSQYGNYLKKLIS